MPWRLGSFPRPTDAVGLCDRTSLLRKGCRTANNVRMHVVNGMRSQGSRKFAEHGENADENPSPCHNCRCRGPQTGFGNDNAALYAEAASARPKEKSRMVLPRPGRLPLHVGDRACRSKQAVVSKGQP